MAKKQLIKAEKMHIVDAIDHLSNMAELEVATSKEELVVRGIKARLQSLKELTPSEREKVLSLVKATFSTIHRYLKHIYDKGESELKDIELQQGVQAMMKLAIEAEEKLKSCTPLLSYTYQEGKLEEIKEYEQLKEFYLESVLKRFQEVVATEEIWESGWEGESLYLNIERVGLKDLETVKRDQQYELFSIRQEDGSSFFNRNLLRHIKLITDFDLLVADFEGEDPLLMIHLLNSEQRQVAAASMKEEVKDGFERFLTNVKKKRRIPLVMPIKKLLLPLVLASDEKNVLTETAGKNCELYLKDYHRFLRELLLSEEHQRLISHPFEEVDLFGQEMIELVDAICFAFFTPLVNRDQWIDYVCALSVRGGHKFGKKKESSLVAPLQELFKVYKSIEGLLKGYPNGPLFKAIDLFRERAEVTGFDPFLQGNLPHYLYTLSGQSLDACCLRLPCPTQHQKIHAAKVIEEFKGYLRFLKRQKKPKTHLLINLQDPTSWQEHSRCEVLSTLTNEKKGASALAMITLPKRGDFYYQTATYANLDEAASFMEIIEEQIKDESYGFIFSPQVKKKEIISFCHKVLPLVHKLFFENKKSLSRKERLDFIEIFYLLLMLKGVELVRPNYLSFSCKDSVDIGAAVNGAFFVLVRLLSSQKTWSIADQKFLSYLFFCPALMVRERLIDSRRFDRVADALIVLAKAFEKSKAAAIKALSPLYRSSFLSSLVIDTLP